jgi:hypothetical protein
MFFYEGAIHKPAIEGDIHLISRPFQPAPPRVFDAMALKAALEAHVKSEKCGIGNICPHVHDYLFPKGKLAMVSASRRERRPGQKERAITPGGAEGTAARGATDTRPSPTAKRTDRPACDGPCADARPAPVSWFRWPYRSWRPAPARFPERASSRAAPGPGPGHSDGSSPRRKSSSRPDRKYTIASAACRKPKFLPISAATARQRKHRRPR